LFKQIPWGYAMKSPLALILMSMPLTVFALNAEYACEKWKRSLNNDRGEEMAGVFDSEKGFSFRAKRIDRLFYMRDTFNQKITVTYIGHHNDSALLFSGKNLEHKTTEIYAVQYKTFKDNDIEIISMDITPAGLYKSGCKRIN